MKKYRDNESYEQDRIRIIEQLQQAKVWAQKFLHIPAQNGGDYDVTIDLLKQSKWAFADAQEGK